MRRSFRFSRVVVPLRGLVQLLAALLDLRPRLPDGVDLPQDLALAIFDFVVGELFVDEGHELADASLVRLEGVPHLHDGARRRRRTRDGLDHGELPALDPFRDLDFTLAREERHGAHLTEVHPDGVVRLVEGTRRQIELELLRPFTRPVEQLVFPVRFFGVDDLDAGASERAEQVVQFVRRRDVSGQQLVDLVVEQIALFLAD